MYYKTFFQVFDDHLDFLERFNTLLLLSFQVVGWNALGAFVVIIWTLVLFGILFLLLKLCGILRISKEAEKDGD